MATMEENNKPKSIEEIQALLQEPFEEIDLEWRVQRSGVSGNQGGYKPWVIVIPYVTNRAIQSRLDDVFGVFNWENVYEETKSGKGYLCGIKVKYYDETGNLNEITKWDGSEYTSVEPLKGALSGAMKRAAVQFGIGRYLYSLEEYFAQCQLCEKQYNATGNFINIKTQRNNKNSPKIGAEWFEPALPNWATPSIKADALLDAIQKSDTIELLQQAWRDAEKYCRSFNKPDFYKKAKRATNERKAELQGQQTQEKETLQCELVGVVTQMINDTVFTSGNESTVAAAKRHLQVKIAELCSSKNVSSSDYIAMLNDACKQRINFLNNQQG